MIAIHQVRDPRWSTCWRHQRIQLKLIHDRVNALCTRKLVVLFQRVQILFGCQRSLGLGFQKKVLPEVGHLFLFVPLVEVNDVLQGVYRSSGPQPRQVIIQVGL